MGLRVCARGSRVTILGRVHVVLGRVDGRVQGVRVQKVPSYHIFVCPVLVPFEVSRKGSRVGVGKDIMQLRQDVKAAQASNVWCAIAPFATVNNKVYCWKTGKGVRVARNQR